MSAEQKPGHGPQDRKPERRINWKLRNLTGIHKPRIESTEPLTKRGKRDA
jgi:hypothetical protein